MSGHTCFLLACTAVLAASVQARSDICTIRARTEAGWVCGLLRRADDNSEYASFRGVPYAKQPVGELRFKELEPVEPWNNFYDARNEGPICMQTDVLYKRLMRPRGMSEACISANIHVPIEALPNQRPTRELEAPRQTADEREEEVPSGLPILVFIHGGGFAFGSGDTDLHGPEYLVKKKVIVITFNYRLNVFGFLSLGTEKIPGNAGLRDMVTLLRWVQRNARAFGGDPDNVTLAGQSAGAIAAHLLTLSSAAKGLFKRAILMSGTATSGFYSPTPAYAQYVQQQLLTVLAINSTDSLEIHQQLVALSAEKLRDANKVLIDQLGLATFTPTVETVFPGVMTVVADYPEVLMAKGCGKDIPLLVGYTDSECETFRGRLEEFDLLQKIDTNPTLIVQPKILFSTDPALLTDVMNKVVQKYYNGTITMDGFVKSCTEGMFEYAALQVAQSRGNTAAPVYLYQFSYESYNSVIKQGLDLTYTGAAHIEDMTFVFKANSVLGARNSYPPQNDDDYMKNFMIKTFVNFMNTGKPVCDEKKWPASSRQQLVYDDIKIPNVYDVVRGPTLEQQEIIKFFDSLTMKVE